MFHHDARILDAHDRGLFRSNVNPRTVVREYALFACLPGAHFLHLLSLLYFQLIPTLTDFLVTILVYVIFFCALLATRGRMRFYRKKKINRSLCRFVPKPPDAVTQAYHHAAQEELRTGRAVWPMRGLPDRESFPAWQELPYVIESDPNIVPDFVPDEDNNSQIIEENKD